MTVSDTASDREPSDRELAREHLALALDVPDRSEALTLVDLFGADFGVMKVGMELFMAEGPSLVRDIVSSGCRVFLDAKLHDIPNTVEHAAQRAGALGVWLLTLHTQGGSDMLAAGARGLAAGAVEAPASAGSAGTEPVALGVTVLTSDVEATPDVLAERTAAAQRAGCGGVVCAAPDLSVVSMAAPGMLRVVPGIRLPGSPSGDQRRVATPSEAVAAGADVLVIGRAVTAARDPVAAAAEVVAEVARELARARSTS